MTFATVLLVALFAFGLLRAIRGCNAPRDDWQADLDHDLESRNGPPPTHETDL